MSYADLAEELFMVMDPEKHRPPHEKMSKMMQGEMAVMRLLDKAEQALLAGEISRKLSMTTSRIAAVLNSLEKKEMIIRSVNPQDGRCIEVRITDKGHSFCEQQRNLVKRDMERMLMQMGEHDASEYVRLVRLAFEIMRKERFNERKQEK